MRWHPSERGHLSERWHQGEEKEARTKYFQVLRSTSYLIIFSHPHRRDGTGCDLNDVNPRVSATAPGPRGDIRAPLLSCIITAGSCVVSTLFTRGNESSCFHLIGMKFVRSQSSSQYTYGAAYSSPDHRRSSYGTTVPGADEAGQERLWEARGPRKSFATN